MILKMIISKSTTTYHLVSIVTLMSYLAGSVAYGLPTLAITRRTNHNIKKLKEIEEINQKLCQVMRVPTDFIDI